MLWLTTSWRQRVASLIRSGVATRSLRPRVECRPRSLSRRGDHVKTRLASSSSCLQNLQRRDAERVFWRGRWAPGRSRRSLPDARRRWRSFDRGPTVLPSSISPCCAVLMVAARKTRQTDRSRISNGRKRHGVGTDTCGRKPRQFEDRVDQQSGLEAYTGSSRTCNDLRQLCGQWSLKAGRCRWRRVRLAHSDVTIGATLVIFAVEVWRSRGAAL
jgi:hypothetical protein